MLPREHRVLMVYLEPAPYIVGFIDEIRSIWRGDIEAVFVHAAFSQPWDYKFRGPAERALPSGALKALSHISQILANERYSLVHLAGWGDPILLGTLLLGSCRRIPVTVETDTPLVQGLPLWKRLTKALLYRLIFKLPSVFLPGGSRQAAYLRGYGVEETRIEIARMTVDVSKIIAYSDSMQSSSKSIVLRRYGIPENRVIILYLGRLEPHKGLFDLLEAFDRLKSEVESVSLLIAGEGSLAAWARQHASSERSIYYVGRLSGERVWEAYSISDIFVLPSHFEPWGLVVNEAMASGLPVIATDRVGCVDDLIEQEQTGLVVPPESPHDLFIAMKALATDSARRRRMGTEAKRVIANWTLENAAKTTVHAWQRSLR
jgi:glycosyltransferase involved in cell wall biosynthesis